MDKDRDQFTFWKSYLESAECIEDDAERGLFYNAVAIYMFYGRDISETLPFAPRTCFRANLPHLKNSIGKSNAAIEREAKKRADKAQKSTDQAQKSTDQAQKSTDQAQEKEQVQEQVQEQLVIAEASACADSIATGDGKKSKCLASIDVSREIMDHFNAVVGTSYKASTEKTRRKIAARMNEGFTVDDIKRVIDNMAAEWGDDEKMARYLRPETLFGTKFEGYLQRGRAPDAGFDPRMVGDFDRWDDGAEEVAAW